MDLQNFTFSLTDQTGYQELSTSVFLVLPATAMHYIFTLCRFYMPFRLIVQYFTPFLGYQKTKKFTDLAGCLLNYLSAVEDDEDTGIESKYRIPSAIDAIFAYRFLSDRLKLTLKQNRPFTTISKFEREIMSKSDILSLLMINFKPGDSRLLLTKSTDFFCKNSADPELIKYIEDILQNVLFYSWIGCGKEESDSIKSQNIFSLVISDLIKYGSIRTFYVNLKLIIYSIISPEFASEILLNELQKYDDNQKKRLLTVILWSYKLERIIDWTVDCFRSYDKLNFIECLISDDLIIMNKPSNQYPLENSSVICGTPLPHDLMDPRNLNRLKAALNSSIVRKGLYSYQIFNVHNDMPITKQPYGIFRKNLVTFLRHIEEDYQATFYKKSN